MITRCSDDDIVVDLKSKYSLDKNFRIFGEITNMFHEKQLHPPLFPFRQALIWLNFRPRKAEFLA